MGKPLGVVSGALVALTTSALLSAKGPTTRITIDGANLARPIAITDGSVAKKFQVWSGPGTFMTVGGVTTEGAEGLIIDWPSGPVAEPAIGPSRYRVSFYVSESRPPLDAPEQLAYVVLYAPDPGAGWGYVYLPGPGDESYQTNVAAMMHGREGHWFHATREWDDIAVPLITR